jgi:apolipoprotein N-acyltransferase
MNIRKNILLALSSGLLLGLPWSIPSLFFLIFIAWVPLLLLEEENQHHQNPYTIFNYAFVSFLLWNILGTWWIAQAQLVGAILIIIANALVQALVFWSISRIRTSLNIPLVFPFLLIWMGYEYFHQSWDLAWPWLNLGNALATVPKLIQWSWWDPLDNSDKSCSIEGMGYLSEKGLGRNRSGWCRNTPAHSHPRLCILSYFSKL